jgi:hypothetical protein
VKIVWEGAKEPASQYTSRRDVLCSEDGQKEKTKVTFLDGKKMTNIVQ